MPTCIVVDDEKHAIKVLEAHIAATPSLKLLGSFRDPLEALGWLSANSVDIVFLDIDMPKITGIEFAKAIKGKAQVILCTAYPEYGAQSYEYDVADYLLKPVDYARFFQSVEKTTRRMAVENPGTAVGQVEFMMLKTGAKMVRINFDDIIYLEADRNYTKFQLTRRCIRQYVMLKEVLDRLPPSRFVRVHHSFVIAINKIEQLDKITVMLKNCDIPIPVSETYRPQLIKILNTAG